MRRVLSILCALCSFGLAGAEAPELVLDADHGSPLNIAAMRCGLDGAIYFLTGGRLTESRLYRVRYTGGTTSGPVRPLLANKELRALRHSLEQRHTPGGGVEAVETAWPFLGHADRPIRYAARIAIENPDLRTLTQYLNTHLPAVPSGRSPDHERDKR